MGCPKSMAKDKMKFPQSTKQKHGYSAKISDALSDSSRGDKEDEDDSDGEEEICSVIKEQISKMTPSETWAVDTDAFSSMTDNHDLFRDVR
jgi:hypothetical protein